MLTINLERDVGSKVTHHVCELGHLICELQGLLWHRLHLLRNAVDREVDLCPVTALSLLSRTRDAWLSTHRLLLLSLSLALCFSHHLLELKRLISFRLAEFHLVKLTAVS